MNLQLFAGPGKSAYDIAKEGGRHAGFFTQYVTRSTSEIQKGIISLDRQIAQHMDKIYNPQKYIPDFGSLHPNQQSHLPGVKWPGDIARLQEQKSILEGILGNR